MYEEKNAKSPQSPGAVQGDAMNSSSLGKAYIGSEQTKRAMTQEEHERIQLTGKSVFFAPPQACKVDTTPEFYPAIITKVNGPSAEFGQQRTADLVTFGPNSVYFQHNVPFSGHGIKAGHWTYRE